MTCFGQFQIYRKFKNYPQNCQKICPKNLSKNYVKKICHKNLSKKSVENLSKFMNLLNFFSDYPKMVIYPMLRSTVLGRFLDLEIMDNSVNALKWPNISNPIYILHVIISVRFLASSCCFSYTKHARILMSFCFVVRRGSASLTTCTIPEI